MRNRDRFLFDTSGSLALERLKRLQRLGYQLILAHPERYEFAKRDPERLKEFYREGILLQVNRGSILGQLGRGAARTADWLLSMGLAGLVASDAHDPVLRTSDLEETARILDLYYGGNASEILLERNPAKILKSAVNTSNIWPVFL